MVDRMEIGNRERGGIRVRDYTTGNLSTDLKSQSGVTGEFGATQPGAFEKVARGLGWYSLAMGLAFALMPRRAQKLMGMRGNHTRLIRSLGLRELFHGFLIFSQKYPRAGVVSRVAGDAVDLAVLRSAFNTRRSNKKRLKVIAASVLGITALDLLTVFNLKRKRPETSAISALTHADLNHRTRAGAFHVSRSITINRPPEVLYQFWRNFENLPQFMYHVEAVYVRADQRSHWVVKAPAGTHVAWDAEITADQPNRLIGWQSLENADVQNSGTVRFDPAPAGYGTVVRVEIDYRPPGGAVGRVIAKLFGEEPAQQVAGDLARFKQVMETGEVVRSEGAPQGLGQKRQPPARPVTEQTLPEPRQGRWTSLRREQAQVFDYRERPNS